MAVIAMAAVRRATGAGEAGHVAGGRRAESTDSSGSSSDSNHGPRGKGKKKAARAREKEGGRGKEGDGEGKTGMRRAPGTSTKPLAPQRAGHAFLPAARSFVFTQDRVASFSLANVAPISPDLSTCTPQAERHRVAL